MIRPILISVWMAAVMLVPTDSAAQLAPLQASPEIEHVVIIVEQNHTFDSYFGSYPGADGFSSDPDVPYYPIPFRPEDRPPDQRLSNGRLTALQAFQSGRMDGFVTAQQNRGRNGDLALVYRDRESAPVLWSVADDFVLFDQYYSSSFGGSLPNTLHLLTGDDHGISSDSKASLSALRSLDTPTVFDRLGDVGLPWRLYVGRLDDLDPDAVLQGRYERSPDPTPSVLYWAPALGMPRFWSDPKLRSGLADQQDYYRDSANGTLPALSVIIPQPTDHPASSGNQGEVRLQSLLNAAIKSPDWDRTAVFVVWDDWGGFADHVNPPSGLGFRVPMLLVSPQAKTGYISGVEHDHTSILNYVVNQFELEPLSTRQQSANTFDDAFRTQPRADRQLVLQHVLDPTPVGTPDQNRTTLMIYVLGFAVAVCGLLLFGSRSRPLSPVDRQPKAPESLAPLSKEGSK